MKIGILTQSMAANYGCNLQAYALQTVLERMGHEVEILDRWGIDPRLGKKTYVQKLKLIIKDIAKICLNRPIYHAISYNDRKYFWRHFLEFQKTYLHLSRPFYNTEDLKSYTLHNHFEGYVVGSDQVWRPDYNKNGMLQNMFLDFADSEDVKRVAYAASFGIDSWTFSEEETQVCALLSKKFDGISVREDSGVGLCRDFLGVDATQVLDPTLLLSKDDYDRIIEGRKTTDINGQLYCYILDSCMEAKRTMERVSEITGFKPYTCLPLMPEGTYRPTDRKASVLPSIEQWLRCFRDAEMVLVDSFHGMVFSIIYNKPFWVVANPKRGITRFVSLLSLLGLEDRIVTYNSIVELDLNRPVDWAKVRSRLHSEKLHSLSYLNKTLNLK